MVNIRNDFFSETECFPVISMGEIESALKLTQRNKAEGVGGGGRGWFNVRTSRLRWSVS